MSTQSRDPTSGPVAPHPGQESQKIKHTPWLKPDTITAIAACLIALCALVVSILQVSLGREHDRLSVKPVFEVTEVSLENGEVGYILENNGLGPGIVRKFEVLFGPKTYELPTKQSEEILKQAVGLSDISTKVTVYTFVGRIIKSGERIPIISSNRSLLSDAELEKYQSVLDHLSFNIEYESMYKERFKFP